MTAPATRDARFKSHIVRVYAVRVFPRQPIPPIPFPAPEVRERVYFKPAEQPHGDERNNIYCPNCNISSSIPFKYVVHYHGKNSLIMTCKEPQLCTALV